MTTKTIVFLSLVTLATAKPILVTFGTHKGPIEPPTVQPPTPKPALRTYRAPAPVLEETQDIPNPHLYKAPVPHQYRKKIYQVSPNFALGSPVDQRYTPSPVNVEIYRSQGREGVQYTGPHVFERQEYEIIEEKKNNNALRYIRPNYYQHKLQKQVPQIGIVYSSGVRYYVPQLVYDDHRQEEEENSVYGKEDEKYYQRKQ